MTGGGGVGPAPRVLCIMGSGETAPTMSAVHEDLMRRAGAPPAPAVLLDTPFGFQENADDLTVRAQTYFRAASGAIVEAASLRAADAATPLDLERMLGQLRRAAWIFAGPGSPSYALRQWNVTQVPRVLADRLRAPGCVVTFASAAACTIGIVALPVYEVYKVGESPRWLAGLDLLAVAGLRCAVIPHYDNAEGGTHDTRYCYMGERRLRRLEADLPEGAAILGVCEHTACILDLDADTASVRGRGDLVIRRRGTEERIASGATVPLDRLRAAAAPATVVTPQLPASPGQSGRTGPPGDPAGAAAHGAEPTLGNPLLEGLFAEREVFAAGRREGDVDAMLSAILAVEQLIVEWMHDSLASDAMDRVRAELRAMLVELGGLARGGVTDPREAVGPYVELALRLREVARREQRWADADAVRDQLAAAGVEVRDRPDGVDWVFRPAPPSA